MLFTGPIDALRSQLNRPGPSIFGWGGDVKKQPSAPFNSIELPKDVLNILELNSRDSWSDIFVDLIFNVKVIKILSRHWTLTFYRYEIAS